MKIPLTASWSMRSLSKCFLLKPSKRFFSLLEKLCTGDVNPDTITALTNEQIRSSGTSNAKVGYIRNLTNALESDALSFDNLKEMSDIDIIREMTKIRGIGAWTAKKYLIFVLNRPDILPVGDGTFLQSYRWAYKPKDCVQRHWWKSAETGNLIPQSQPITYIEH